MLQNNRVYKGIPPYTNPSIVYLVYKGIPPYTNHSIVYLVYKGIPPPLPLPLLTTQLYTCGAGLCLNESKYKSLYCIPGMQG